MANEPFRCKTCDCPLVSEDGLGHYCPNCRRYEALAKRLEAVEKVLTPLVQRAWISDRPLTQAEYLRGAELEAELPPPADTAGEEGSRGE